MAAKQKAEERILFYDKKVSAGEKIRLGVIGFGIQGHFDLTTALKVPGVELAGICDLYTGRLDNANMSSTYTKMYSVYLYPSDFVAAHNHTSGSAFDGSNPYP